MSASHAISGKIELCVLCFICKDSVEEMSFFYKTGKIGIIDLACVV